MGHLEIIADQSYLDMCVCVCVWDESSTTVTSCFEMQKSRQFNSINDDAHFIVDANGVCVCQRRNVLLQSVMLDV